MFDYGLRIHKANSRPFSAIVLSVVVAATFLLNIHVARAGIDANSSDTAGTSTALSVSVDGSTLKLKRIRRLTLDLPDGMSLNTAIGPGRCRPTAYLRRECSGSSTVGAVGVVVAYRGRRHRLAGLLRLLRTGRGMVATYGVELAIPSSLGMQQRLMRLTDRVRLRPGDGGISHSFGDVYRDLSGRGRVIESMTVRFNQRVGSGRKAATLVVNPARCDRAEFKVSATTWAGFFRPVRSSRKFRGCERLKFDPVMAFAAARGSRRVSTSFSVELGAPGGAPLARGAHLSGATLRMPAGSSWNEVALGSLPSCTSAQARMLACPSASRIGTASAKVLGSTFQGAMHIVQSAGGAQRFRVFLASALNARVEIAGSLSTESEADGGRSVLTVEDTPQLPLWLRLDFSAAILVNSRRCGDNMVDAELRSHARSRVSRTASYVVSGCPGPPAAPRVTSGPSHDAFIGHDDVSYSFEESDPSPEDPVRYECSPNGDPFESCASPYGADDIGEGAFTFAVRAIRDEQAGPATTRVFTVDMRAPAVAITAPTAAYQGDASPSLSVSVVETNAKTTECSVDSASYGLCPASLGPLADGAHTVRARHTDKAGNVGYSPVKSFTVDTVDPQITIDPPHGLSAYTRDSTLEYAVVDANKAASSTCTVTGAGGSSGPCANNGTISLADGAHTVTIGHTDKAGNAATVTATFTLDTVDPDVDIAAPAEGLFTDEPSQTLHFSVTDATATTCDATDGQTRNLSEGPNTIEVTCTDAAGNDGSDSVSVTLDTVDPDVEITSPTDGLITDQPAQTLHFTVDDATATTCDAADGETRNLTEGPNTIEVTCTDAAGNAGSDSVSVTLDTTDPQVAIDSPLDQSTVVDANGDVTVSFGVVDATATTATCAFDSDPPQTCVDEDTFSGLVPGPHTLTVIVTDAAGNDGQAVSAFELSAGP